MGLRSVQAPEYPDDFWAVPNLDMFNRIAKDQAAIKNETSSVQQRDNPARACARIFLRSALDAFGSTSMPPWVASWS